MLVLYADAFRRLASLTFDFCEYQDYRSRPLAWTAALFALPSPAGSGVVTRVLHCRIRKRGLACVQHAANENNLQPQCGIPETSVTFLHRRRKTAAH
jgi:hypothetical protein